MPYMPKHRAERLYPDQPELQGQPAMLVRKVTLVLQGLRAPQGLLAQQAIPALLAHKVRKVLRAIPRYRGHRSRWNYWRNR